MEETREQKLWTKIAKSGNRVRDKNRAEGRLLSRHLNQLSNSSDRAALMIQKDISQIKDQIWKQEGLEQFNAGEEMDRVTTDLRVPSHSTLGGKSRVKSAPPLTMNSTSPQTWKHCPRMTHNYGEPCKYMKTYGCPGVFPCRKVSSTYNKMGFDIVSQGNGCNQFTTSHQMFAKSREGFIIELESQSVRRPLRTAMDQTNHKIFALKTLIKQMKVNSEINKPKDWNINYGKPTSRRKLLKVARPCSVEDFEGL